MDAKPRRYPEILVVTVLLVLHWGLAVSSSVEKSATFDEVAHVAAGYLYWTAGDYRFNPESGNLPQRWAALPLLAQRVAVPPPESPARRQGNVWTAGRDVLFRLGNDAESMLFAARSMIALSSVALGALVYLWSRALFGRGGAVLSLVLYAWSPTVLAHSRLVTADLAAALFFLLAIGTLARLLERVTAGRLLAAGLATGALVLTKTSWLLLLPMTALLVVWRLCSTRNGIARRLAAAAAVTGLVVALVWSAYGWRYRAAGDAGGSFVHSWESRLEGAGAAASAIRLARDHRLLPEAFLWGLAYTLTTTQERDAFFRGDYSSTGWRTFFPFAFLVKTPLPLLGLLLLAGGAWVYGDRSPRRTAPLWILFGVYAAAAVASSLNLGHRHLLPLYPVLFIMAGRAAFWLRARKAIAGLMVVLLGLFVADSWLIRPHYLSYFNALAGGPENAYHQLVDSSLDWGQDLPALADWLEANADGPPVYVAYFGTAVPAYYGIEANWLHSYFPAGPSPPPEPLSGGIYCVSATLLQTIHTGRSGPWTEAFEAEYQALRREMTQYWESGRPPADWAEVFASFNQLRSVRLYHFLRDRAPDARAGYSILIFRLSDGEVRRPQGDG